MTSSKWVVLELNFDLQAKHMANPDVKYKMGPMELGDIFCDGA